MSAHAKEGGYARPSLTADIVVIAPGGPGGGGGLQVLLIQRGSEPFQGRWAFPGGFCEPDESVEQAAERELQEETGLTGVRLEQVHAFTAPGRDPRGWVVSVAHLALVPARRLADATAGDDARDARWWRLRAGPGGAIRLEDPGTPPAAAAGGGTGEGAGPLAFDHDQVLAMALARLARDADTRVPELLDAPFTAADLGRTHAAILELVRGPGGARVDPEALAARLVAEGAIRRVGGGGEGQGEGGQARYVAAPGAPRG